MKKGILEEAIKNIPEEYKLEALETHIQEAEITSLSKRNTHRKILVVAIAVSFILALGITAGATGLFGMVLRAPMPNETIKIEYYDFNVNGISEKTIVIDDISKVVTFDGPEECQEVQFKANYLPEIEQSIGGEFGNPDSWNDFLQVETKAGVVNIYLFYSAQLGKDGCLYLQDNVYKETRGMMGEYEIAKLSADPNFDGDPVKVDYTNQYLIMYHPDGHIIVIAGSIEIEEMEKIAQQIEVRKGKSTIKYNPDGDHQLQLWSGVG